MANFIIDGTVSLVLFRPGLFYKGFVRIQFRLLYLVYRLYVTGETQSSSELIPPSVQVHFIF